MIDKWGNGATEYYYAKGRGPLDPPDSKGRDSYMVYRDSDGIWKVLGEPVFKYPDLQKGRIKNIL